MSELKAGWLGGAHLSFGIRWPWWHRDHDDAKGSWGLLIG